jgi:hypothetical protein
MLQAGVAIKIMMVTEEILLQDHKDQVTIEDEAEEEEKAVEEVVP